MQKTRKRFVEEIKGDLYHLGGTLYSLLIGKEYNEVINVNGKKGKKGRDVLPSFEHEIFANSTHPIDKAVVEAMEVSFKYYYDETAGLNGAREVADILEKAYQNTVNPPRKVKRKRRRGRRKRHH